MPWRPREVSSLQRIIEQFEADAIRAARKYGLPPGLVADVLKLDWIASEGSARMTSGPVQHALDTDFPAADGFRIVRSSSSEEVIIRKISIENLFAAEGTVDLELDHGPDRYLPQAYSGRDSADLRIALAMKLLLLGTASERVRTVGFPPKLLDPRDFVFGIPGLWPGILSPRASGRGRAGSARVRAVLEHRNEIEVIERCWTFDNGVFEEETNLELDMHVRGDEPFVTAFDLLPEDIVLLHFQDGGEFAGLFDDPERRRLIFDHLAEARMFDTLVCAIRLNVPSAAPSRPEWPDSNDGPTRRQAEIALDLLRQRVSSMQWELDAAERDLQRLGDLLGLARRIHGRPAAVPSEWAARYREPHGISNLPRQPINEAHAFGGTACAELRFVEISAQANELVEAIAAENAEISAWLDRLDALPTEPDDQAERTDMSESTTPAQRASRLIACLEEIAAAVRRSRLDEVAVHLNAVDFELPEAEGFGIAFNTHGDRLFRSTDGTPLDLVNLSPGFRERLSLAFIDALRRTASYPFPFLLDDPWAHVAWETRDWAMRRLFGNGDAQTIILQADP